MPDARPRPDWDADSPQLRANLERCLERIRTDAQRRTKPTCHDAIAWHTEIMNGLEVPSAAYVGAFRGSRKALARLQVRVGKARAVHARHVGDELLRFEIALQNSVAELDARYATPELLDEDGLAAVIELAAWAHSEWVRIHPIVNGNGRTARLWANSILMRYGLPPAIRLRPRPEGGYGTAAAFAMEGDSEPTAAVFWEMVAEAMSR